MNRAPLAEVTSDNLRLSEVRIEQGGRIPCRLAWTTKVPNAPPPEVARVTAVWSVEGALLAAILFVLPFVVRRCRREIPASLNAAVGGSMVVAMNVASEYGFGAVITVLPGFHAIQSALSRSVSDPLLNVAVTTNSLTAVTGSSSGV